MDEKKIYSYSYSADENNEIKKIREKYTQANKTETKLDQLRRLDASVHNRASVLSITVGIIGTLLLGIGMTGVTVWADKMFVPGIIIGTIGIITVCLAYPLYKIKSEKVRKEITPIILKLTDELMK